MVSNQHVFRHWVSRLPLKLAAAGLASVALTSCNSGPPRVTQPSIDAGGAGEMAMELYDANGDGMVAGDEFIKVPGLKAALPKMDTNSDQSISADEIAARIEQWKTMQVGVLSFGCFVTMDGKPLEGATVTFEPEPFLGDEVKASVATTDELGSGGMSIPKEMRADPKTSPPGTHLGIYKVKVSKMVNGKETIPATYNEQTTLGVEVAPDVSDILNRRLTFALKST